MSTTGPTDDQLDLLLGVLQLTRSDEMTCEQWLDQVGSYLRAVRETGPLSEELKRIEHHFKLCPECREEFEAIQTAWEEK
ncbi:hypothetical protein K2X85_17485 [bacterium]|jgi:hypothetical protein|nr:hypothetical protein [bacterium]